MPPTVEEIELIQETINQLKPTKKPPFQPGKPFEIIRYSLSDSIHIQKAGKPIKKVILLEGAEKKAGIENLLSRDAAMNDTEMLDQLESVCYELVFVDGSKEQFYLNLELPKEQSRRSFLENSLISTFGPLTRAIQQDPRSLEGSEKELVEMMQAMSLRFGGPETIQKHCETNMSAEDQALSARLKAFLNFNHLLRRYGYNDGAFAGRGNSAYKPLMWQTGTVKQVYSSSLSANAYYKEAHRKIVLLLQQLPSHDLHVISVGGGDGREIKAIHTALKESHTLHFSYMDINPENMREAQSSLEDVDVTYLNVNAKKMKASLALLNQTRGPLPRSVTQVCIFSGFLADQIHRGSYEAVQTLQQVSSSIRYCIMAQFSGGYINNRIAKHIGFNMQAQELIEAAEGFRNNPVILCKRQTPAERCEFLRKISDKRSRRAQTLDLSMSADPLRDIYLLQGNGYPVDDVMNLDLSWAQIELGQIPAVIERLVSDFPKLEKILVSRNEPWFEEFFAAAFSKLPELMFRQRTDNLRDETSVSILSRPMLSRLNRGAQQLLQVEKIEPPMLPQLSRS